MPGLGVGGILRLARVQASSLGLSDLLASPFLLAHAHNQRGNLASRLWQAHRDFHVHLAAAGGSLALLSCVHVLHLGCLSVWLRRMAEFPKRKRQYPTAPCGPQRPLTPSSRV